MSDHEGPARVAIACQGGGSHTAFTAGVLRELLAQWDDERYQLVGISGTSGGAFNALGFWYGFVTEGPERAGEIVGSLWDDLATDGAADRWMNNWVRTASKLESAGYPLPAVSPYQIPGPELGKARIREILESHIEFDAIPGLCTYECPELVVGTVDVNEGVFDTFTNENVTVDAVLASAAVPSLFEAVDVDGTLHWDGLFSQNPPIDDLMHLPPERKPDELWIIQVNSQQYTGEPTTVDAIADRRNELSGNISLNQELRFIEQVNEWVEEGKLPPEEFAKTDISRIQMDRQLHSATKVDRSAGFLAELRELGRERAKAFLAGRSE